EGGDGRTDDLESDRPRGCRRRGAGQLDAEDDLFHRPAALPAELGRPAVAEPAGVIELALPLDEEREAPVEIGRQATRGLPPEPVPVARPAVRAVGLRREEGPAA